MPSLHDFLASAEGGRHGEFDNVSSPDSFSLFRYCIILIHLFSNDYTIIYNYCIIIEQCSPTWTQTQYQSQYIDLFGPSMCEHATIPQSEQVWSIRVHYSKWKEGSESTLLGDTEELLYCDRWHNASDGPGCTHCAFNVA
jgi:hypothetical protein